MAKPFFLFFLLIICLLSSTPESHRPPPFLGKSPRLLKTQNILVQPKYTYETRYFDQTLDHFSFNDLPKFQQHYLINSDHWVGAGPNRLGPIFLYCGNEGDIEWFAANTDFVWELAPRFGAMVIFPEHRYYGESMPYGSQKEAYKNASTLVYLTAEQALADYALLITNLKRNLSAEASPVILFGGSYGGMLVGLVAPPPMSSPAPGTSPPSPLDPSVSNTTTSPTATFPLLPPTNATSIGSEPTLSPPAQNRSSSNSALVALGIGIGIGGAVVLVFVGVFVVWYRRRKRRRRALSESSAPLGFKDEFGITPQNWQHNAPSSKENINGLPPKFTNSPLNASCFQLPSLGSSAPPPPPPHSTSSAGSEKQNPQPQSTMGQGYPNSKTIFSYEELATATQGFSQVNLLGQGGFGYVHKGVLPNGEIVAIKQLKVGSGQGEREFQAEVAIISRVHHKHLVTLVGYCISGIQRMLVYEFVPNKTLEFHLHGKEHGPLNWEMRMKIALGSAKGLAYLHEDCQPKIIHRDIKSANILLDINFEPKVADFGLARFTSETDTHVSTRVMGTFGYLAPEYALTGKLTEKSDVFSFGVMLLELITGRRPIDKAQFLDDNIVDWARPLLNEALENGDFRSLVDSGLNGDYDSGEMSRMIACAAVCVRHLARRRPSMTQIARALEGNLPLEDLDEGLKPGHIKFNASHESSDFDTAQYREELKKFQKMAFESQNNSSVWSAPTTSFGQQPSGSSSSTHDLGSTKLVQQ